VAANTGQIASGKLTKASEGGSASDTGNRVRVATGWNAAEMEMKRNPADVLFINVQVGDNAGLGLIRLIQTALA